jgi:hypothetical protein
VTLTVARLQIIRGITCLVLSGFIATAASSAPSAKTDVGYDITVRIDPASRRIEGRSLITVSAAGELTLVLGRRFEVTHALVDGLPMGRSISGTVNTQAWRIPRRQHGQRRIEIHWRGELAPMDSSLEHRQTLGRTEPASGSAGTFLPDSSGWYPHLVGTLPRYRVSLELPSGQRGLVAGRLIDESETAEGYRASFEFPFPSEGIDLMAGPYVIETDTMRGAGGKPIQLRTYFHPQIRDLAKKYREEVKGYIEFYETWIGEYPFTEFSVVSSPTPTGFGMPTLTYLGIEVLRLPFIRATSLGHEVLHNWWGNGVYPDYANGNWSEGLTTFMADYAYKEREGPEAAREMRVGWLRDFSALASGQDAPLTEFTSRTHGASQIVGYNKAAMVFLMMRDLLGQETFDRALQLFWHEQRFRVASWADLQRAFETVSGRDLRVFFRQWLTRPGAPVVRIAEAVRTYSDSSHRVTITLEQSAPTYQLRVPIGLRTEDGEEVRMLDLEQKRQTFILEVPARPIEVTLDPGLRLFRQLMPQEAPPILRQVMVDETVVSVLLPETGEAYAAAELLATKLQNRSPRIISATNALPTVSVLVIGLHDQIDAWLARRQLPVRPGIVQGKGSAQAWTVSRPGGAVVTLVSARDVTALAALARPLPHYGRQSYVVFEGAKMIERGIWPMRMQVMKID